MTNPDSLYLILSDFGKLGKIYDDTISIWISIKTLLAEKKPTYLNFHKNSIGWKKTT